MPWVTRTAVEKIIFWAIFTCHSVTLERLVWVIRPGSSTQRTFEMGEGSCGQLKYLCGTYKSPLTMALHSFYEGKDSKCSTVVFPQIGWCILRVFYPKALFGTGVLHSNVFFVVKKGFTSCTQCRPKLTGCITAIYCDDESHQSSVAVHLVVQGCHKDRYS